MTVYDASIKMAYRPFTEKSKTEVFDRYLKTAQENASEPIFISDIKQEEPDRTVLEIIEGQLKP